MPPVEPLKRQWVSIQSYAGGLDIPLDTRRVRADMVDNIKMFHRIIEEQRILIGVHEHEINNQKTKESRHG